MPELWYLSFADQSGWLGGCVVRATGLSTAAAEARSLGIYPGGETKGATVEGKAIPGGVLIPRDFRNRLLDRNEVAQVDAIIGGDGEAVRW